MQTEFGQRVNGIAAFEFWQFPDGFTGPLLSEAQVINALQVQPELGASTEEMSETQCSVARDGACSVRDLRDPIGRNIQPLPALRQDVPPDELQSQP